MKEVGWDMNEWEEKGVKIIQPVFASVFACDLVLRITCHQVYHPSLEYCGHCTQSF